jgi:hypothetical protein
MRKTEEKCEEITKLLKTLPMLHKPSDVPFLNGLYFFYEKGEVSGHAPEGRVVRIGNHPRARDGLKKRLSLHYSGNKNSSVFRRLVGGAILRKNNPGDSCLSPEPGKGHWEKQKLHSCEKCKPIKNEINKLLENNFYFRCLEVVDLNLRNSLEKKLVATISLCPLCSKPSKNWLGKYAYPEKVKKSGLWNSDYVFKTSYIINDNDLKDLKELTANTLKKF